MVGIPEALAIASSLLVAAIVFLGLRGGSGKRPNLPPGPMGLPLIGHTIPFMTPHSSSSLGLFVDRCIERHGSRIFTMNLLGKPTVVSADPEFNRFILQSEGRMFESNVPTSIAEIMGRWSMISLVGDVHREMRSIAVGFMSGAKLRTYFLPDVEAQALAVLSSWRVDGTVFSGVEEGKKFAFNLMVKHLMSMDPSMPETETLRMEYHHFMKGMASIPLNLPGTNYRRALKSRHAILKIIGQKLDERVAKIKKGVEEVEEEDDLLASVARNPNLTRDQILDLIISMLFAGHETSSAAISLALYFLQSSPDVLRQLREEQVDIAKKKEDKGETSLTWDDYKQMEFTHCVINETLRLGNIVKFLHRRTIMDVHYKGFDIPCGWEVVPIISAAHLDPSIYDEPLKYNPWRWQQSTSTAIATTKNNNVMSFSGGPRLCPGAELAKMEMAVFLHHLVRRFDWELAEHDYPVSFPFLGFPKQLPIRLRHLPAAASAIECLID